MVVIGWLKRRWGGDEGMVCVRGGGWRGKSSFAKLHCFADTKAIVVRSGTKQSLCKTLFLINSSYITMNVLMLLKILYYRFSSRKKKDLRWWLILFKRLTFVWQYNRWWNRLNKQSHIFLNLFDIKRNECPDVRNGLSYGSFIINGVIDKFTKRIEQ